MGVNSDSFHWGMQFSKLREPGGKIHEQGAQNEIGEILRSNLRRIEVALNKQNKNRAHALYLK